MNKKFSTLLAGLVLATGMTSAQTYISPNPFTLDPITGAGGFPYRTMDTKVTGAFNATYANQAINKIESENKWYQLTDGNTTVADAMVLIQVRDAVTGNVTLKMVKAVDAVAGNVPLNYSLWKIKVTNHPTSAAKVYTFINKETNLELVLDDTGAFDVVASGLTNVNSRFGTVLSGCTNEWGWYGTDAVTTGTFGVKPIYSYFHNLDSVMVMELNRANEVVATKYSKADAGIDLVDINPLELMPVIAQGVSLTADDLNAMIDAQEINTLNPADSAKFKFSEAIGKLDAPLQTILNNTLGSERGFKAYDQYLFREFGYAGLTDVATELTTVKTVLENASTIFEAVATADAAATALATTAAGDATTAANTASIAATAAEDAADAVYTDKITSLVSATDIAGAATIEFGNGAVALGIDGTPATGSVLAFDNALASIVTIIGTPGVSNATKATLATLGTALEKARKVAIDANARAVEGEAAMPLTITFTSGDEKVNTFGIRLVDENSKFFMVDTLRYEEDQAPSTSPAYKLVTKDFNIKADGAYLAARYFFRITYYPSNDSLAIEPLNAASKSNAEATAKTNWLDTDAGNGWIKTTDTGGANVGMTVSNTETNTAAGSPIAFTTSRLIVDGSVVATVGPRDPSGSFRTRVSFNHVYPYLVRSTEEPGLYNISLVTKDQQSNATTLSRVNGSYLIANMAGDFVYAKKDKSQDYTHMPATQWVVEQLGCLKPNSEVARVKVTNREYADVAFEGQLYTDADGNKYIINRTPSLNMANNKFHYRDTLMFAPIADTKKGYLNFEESALRENVYTFNQFFNYGEDPYFLNVKDNKADTLVRSQEEATEFELFISNKNLTYGYVSTQAGVAQLYRTSYKVKVKDANKIDNDRKYMAVDQNNKYVVAKEADIDVALNGLRYAKFYFKENNHWVEGETGKEYHALVDSVNLTNGNWKLAIEQGQMDTKPESLGESRTDAFLIGSVARPLYRSLGKGNSVVKIFTERGTAKEYLYEDANNKIGYPAAIKDFSYLGLTAQGISQKGEGNTVAVYADYVQKSNDRMPQYLFAVTPDSVKAYTWCKDHGLNASCEHSKEYAGYVAGRFMINLNDSVANSINKLTDANNFKYDNYTRLAFVEAIHRGDSLYVLKNGTELASLMGKDASGKAYVLPAFFDKVNEGETYDVVELKGQHNNAAFSLRLVDDAEAQDFYLESHSNAAGESALGSFDGAWVKLQNYVPVLAQNYNANGNHGGTSNNINENINQAQKFNIAENVEENATGNDDITATSVSVVGDNGKVIIKGATGKNVVISNVLGQSLSNTAITSDNATITVPAGIVIVTVEGEAAVKAMVK